MSDELNRKFNSSAPNIYQIKIKGHLGDQWSDWFNELTFTRNSDGTTLLTGEIIDEAALHGLLKKIRDLGMPLLSVNSIKLGAQDETKSDAQGDPNIETK